MCAAASASDTSRAALPMTMPSSASKIARPAQAGMAISAPDGAYAFGGFTKSKGASGWSRLFFSRAAWKLFHSAIIFDGRQGFLRLAHQAGVKIVPVVSTGGQDTFFVYNDGRKWAKRLRFDKYLRVKSLPLSSSFPWLLTPGDLPHVPLPAKIRIEVLDPIDLNARFGDDPDWDAAYDYVTSVMQAGLSSLAAKTMFPVLG